jgi:hypothetical protein
LTPTLSSDHYVVFGSNFIKGPLGDFLVKNRAKNVNMGVSPYCRIASCDFWALYDARPDLVGATINVFNKKLDGGSMLFHALPEANEVGPLF